ncbi:MAG: YncE family protein [Hyphomicrobium sp.]
MKEVGRFAANARPYAIAVAKDGKTVAVGVADEEKLKFFDAKEFTLRDETPIGPMYNDHLVLTQDGKHILVANFDSDDVVGVDGRRYRRRSASRARAPRTSSNTGASGSSCS